MHLDDAEDAVWSERDLAVGLEHVKEIFRRYGLLDERVRFLPGWFRDTLPTAPVERLSILRLDGDLYESTMTARESFYPRLFTGGYVIVDDYQTVRGCRRAVDDFRAARHHGRAATSRLALRLPAPVGLTSRRFLHAFWAI